MAVSRLCIKLACEEFNFIWDEKQILELYRQWSKGLSIHELSKMFRRKREEVVIALLDVMDDHEKAAMFPRWGMVPRRRLKEVNDEIHNY